MGGRRGGALDGDVALVTGAGRGIGRAIALAYAAAGARVVVSSRTRADLDVVVEEIEAAGGKAVVRVADVSVRAAARALTQWVIERYGRLTVLVNNAGGVVTPHDASDHDPFDYNEEAFAGTVALNLMAAHWTGSVALPHMRERGYGRVINVGSGASKGVTPSPVAYHAAKHGLVGLTRALAAAAAPHGITVNCLCPGPTRTSLYTSAHALMVQADAAVAHAEPDATPPNLQERVLEPAEIAPMAVLLGSRAGGGITGQVISVDGGYKV